MWTKEVIIYMAAIIDGEGSLSIAKMSPCKKRPYAFFTPSLCIINTNKDLMDWLILNFGGNFSTRKKIENRKTCYRWFACGSKIQNILEQTLPYMIIKKEIANLIIEFRKTVGKTGWRMPQEIWDLRQQLYLQSRQLNKVGE